MDLRSGKTYETREAALASGVPASDLVEVENTPKGPRVRVPFEPTANPKYPTRHHGTREMRRRLSRQRQEVA